MIAVRRCRSLAVLVLVAACNSAPVQPDIPAVIVEPDDASRAELRQVVSTALNGADVTLADDALTLESSLSVEHPQHRGIEQQPLRGRDLGRPETFHLVLDGSQCVLVHDNTGLRWLLLDTRCRAQ
ncbi:MAG: hypothetical protein U5K38_10335 [Woeseiaceae bacterium]|nr:hypothetical protein [Woeseiaceae bacterium]